MGVGGKKRGAVNYDVDMNSYGLPTVYTALTDLNICDHISWKPPLDSKFLANLLGTWPNSTSETAERSC